MLVFTCHKRAQICLGISNTHGLTLFSHSHITLGNVTEFGGVHDLGDGEKGADSLCSQSEPVPLVLDLALRRAWIWPCLFISLGNSLNCFPTMSSKQQSQHSINRLGIFLASGFPQHRKQLLFSLHSC